EVVTLSKGPAKVFDDDGVGVHRVPPHAFPGAVGLMDMCMPYTRNVLSELVGLWLKFHELHRKKPFDVVDTPELLGEGFFSGITRAAPLLIRLYTPHSKFIAERLHNITP